MDLARQLCKDAKRRKKRWLGRSAQFVDVPCFSIVIIWDGPAATGFYCERSNYDPRRRSRTKKVSSLQKCSLEPVVRVTMASSLSKNEKEKDGRMEKHVKIYNGRYCSCKYKCMSKAFKVEIGLGMGEKLEHGV